jgi:hypothetical protein
MARASLTFLSEYPIVGGSRVVDQIVHPCLFLRAEIKYRGVRSFDNRGNERSMMVLVVRVFEGCNRGEAPLRIIRT